MSEIKTMPKECAALAHELGISTGLCSTVLNGDVLIVTTDEGDWFVFKTNVTYKLDETQSRKFNEPSEAALNVYMISSCHPLSTKFSEEDDESGYAFTAIAAVKHCILESMEKRVDEAISQIIPKAQQIRESLEFKKDLEELTAALDEGESKDKVIH
tara:strand:+ start:812 stop:1282 length:471 start_codon:yes stop_codon:yes gene_type:complete